VTITGTAEEVWIYDVGAGTLEQMTFESVNTAPVWTPDGTRIAFSSNRAGALNLYMARADGAGATERLTTSNNIQFPGSWSPDGSLLAYVEHHPNTGRDIWILQNDTGRSARPLVVTPFDETAPAFSPDGRWMAFVSNQSGASDVYVRSVTDSGLVLRVSTDGGSEPVWSRDGRDLYYRSGRRLLAVPMMLGTRMSAGRPRVVHEGEFARGTADRANYDLGPGGRLVVVGGSDEPAAPADFQILMNWTVERSNPSP
jgi:Tol biopolymer transport system component